jgi:hypothetical protein
MLKIMMIGVEKNDSGLERQRDSVIGKTCKNMAILVLWRAPHRHLDVV